MDKWQVTKPLSLTATTLASFALASSAFASGFRVPELSTVGTGTSNALIANTSELGALPYNPAAMSFHDGKGLVGGLTVINYELSVEPTGGTPTDNVGDETFYVPNFYAMARGNGPWSFGLAVNAPFGLETSWPDDTFPNFGGVDALEPALSRILMVNINPNFAYKIDDTASVAFGVNFYNVQDLRFNTHDVTIKGKGSGIGFNLGYQKKVNQLTFGLSYKSAVETDVYGTFDPTALGGPTNVALAASAEIEFPDMIQAGVAYQATDKLEIELDVERTGWSSFDQIEVKSAGGTTLTSSTNNWDDAWAYRLGAIYQLSPKTRLMFGYSYDETPQPDSFFSARVPDNDRQLFSVGAMHDFGGWTLEAAFMHVVVDDRTVNSSTTYTPGGEPNGTQAYNGTYDSTVDLLSIGASVKF